MSDKLEMNPMFESILRDTLGTYSISSYTKKDMETMYVAIITECMKVTRKHTLSKFGIPDEFTGTTQIERVIAEHFGVKNER